MKLLLPTNKSGHCQKVKNAKFKKVIRCSGCMKLYGGWTSFYDHAVDCEKLHEKGEFLISKGVEGL